MKFSICNELFGAIPFEKQCNMIATEGFSGVEIAPFTVDETPWLLNTRATSNCKNALQNSGLTFAGLHWLLVKPEGLLITSENPAKRSEAIDHIRRLLDFSGNLGGGCLIFGSPKGRNAQGTVTIQQAEDYFVEALRDLAPHARAASSVICIEALDKTQSNIVNTLSDAQRIVRKIADPGVSSMFDFHNTADETSEWESLVEDFKDIISHVHVNRVDGSWPREKDAAVFSPVFKRLEKNGYSGWISLEIFTKPSNPLQILKETKHFFKKTSAWSVDFT